MIAGRNYLRENNMNVYVCVTLYHVYLTLMQIMSEDAEGNSSGGRSKSIILLNANDAQIYKQYEYIAKQLKSTGYYCDLRFRTKRNELLGIERQKNREQLKLVYEMMQKIGEKEFTLFNFAWNKSYVYSTAALLYKKCNQAIFIEEGVTIGTMSEEKAWKKLFHKLLYGGTDFYKDKKLKEIQVQKPGTYPEVWKNKLSVLDVRSMANKLDAQDKNQMLKIMSQEGERMGEFLNEPGIGILYSGPYSEDGYITEKQKLEYIMCMCNFYKQYGKIILKLHPRDTSTYPVGDDIRVLSGAFPSELLNFTGYCFKFAVSICSGAVETTYAEHKINMNENFLHDSKFILRDINGELVENCAEACKQE